MISLTIRFDHNLMTLEECIKHNTDGSEITFAQNFSNELQDLLEVSMEHQGWSYFSALLQNYSRDHSTNTNHIRN